MWEESDLCKALGSLNLHHRIVSLGLDGSLQYDISEDSACFINSDNDTDSQCNRVPHTNNINNSVDSTGSPYLATTRDVIGHTLMSSCDNITESRALMGLSPSLECVDTSSREYSPPLTSSYQSTISIPNTSTTNNNTFSHLSDFCTDSKSRRYKLGESPSKTMQNNIDCTGVNNMMSKFFTRSVLWRIYLRLLPFPYTGTTIETIIKEWPTKLYTSRAWYSCRKQELVACYAPLKYVDEDCALMERSLNVCPTLMYDDAIDDPGNRCKSQETSSKSYQYTHGRTSLREVDQSPLDTAPEIVKDDIITHDIRRSYAYADHEVPHHILYMILSMWRWLNPVVGYQQGMHELAGNIVIMLTKASLSVPKNTPQGVAECGNAAFIEADAYHIFDAMMNELGLIELFADSAAVPHQRKPATSYAHHYECNCNIPCPMNYATSDGSDHIQESNLRRCDFLSSADAGLALDNFHNHSVEMTTLTSLCHHIVFELLKDQTSNLFNHFDSTRMLDQVILFLPRWLKNLFTREVSRSQVYVVWDGIFAVYYHDIVTTRLERVKGTYVGAPRTLAAKDCQMLDTDVGNYPPSPSMPHLLFNSNFNCASTDVKYAGQESTQSEYLNGTDANELPNEDNNALTNSNDDVRSGVGGCRRVGVFFRTISGVALALLLYIQDDLTETDEDFSQLKRLTRTPLVSGDVDTVSLMCSATNIARTRPSGIVMLNSARLLQEGVVSVKEPMDNTERQSAHKNSRYNLRGVSCGRLSREELLVQQKSVSVVISSISDRLRQCLPPLSEPVYEPLSKKDKLNGGKAFSSKSQSSSDVLITEETLRTLHVIVLELGYLAEKLS